MVDGATSAMRPSFQWQQILENKLLSLHNRMWASKRTTCSDQRFQKLQQRMEVFGEKDIWKFNCNTVYTHHSSCHVVVFREVTSIQVQVPHSVNAIIIVKWLDIRKKKKTRSDQTNSGKISRPCNFNEFAAPTGVAQRTAHKQWAIISLQVIKTQTCFPPKNTHESMRGLWPKNVKTRQGTTHKR